MAIQMDEHEAGTRNTGSVELLALSPREWRISDTSMPVGDAGSVLGFAERVCDGRYEVLRLGHGSGIERLTFASLDDVRGFFEKRLSR
jgi:hypothetical protein